VHNSVQGFSCEINCTKVKQTSTKLHKSPDKTDRAQSRSLLEMRDSDSGPKPGLRGTPHSCTSSNQNWRGSTFRIQNDFSGLHSFI